MSLLSEIENLMNQTGSSFSYRIINLGGKNLYIEGIKSVISLSEEMMIFQLKNQMLQIVGNELKIKYLDKTTSVVVGNICTVEVK